MYAVRYKNALPILPFPDVDCTNADKGTIYFIKFYANFIVYKFGYERVEGDGASGGSNDGILLALHRNESLECNPAPYFFSAHVKVLDELKQCVCSYYHWVVLLLVLSDGIRLSSPVFLSAVLIILAFINLWRGADLYLSHPSVFIRKWRLITIYLLAAVFLRIAALNIVIVGTFNEPSLIHEPIELYVTVMQQHYRGVVLQTQLIYKAMTYHQQRDYRRLAKIKRTVGAMTNLNLPFGEWFIECEFYHKHCLATVIVSTFVQAEWTNSEGYNDLKIGIFSDFSAIRGWNENLLHTVDSATENVEETTSTSEIKTGQDDRMKGIKKTQTQYITISALLSTCALWMARKTLSYRYIRFVINEEKRLLLEKLPKELTLASQNSLGKLEKCNLGNEICLVTSSRDIVNSLTGT
uniref:Uncharacterized protein n=1 Tax=Brugia malayi TaxID=6279 RepID=A8Q8A1_BRUMA